MGLQNKTKQNKTKQKKTFTKIGVFIQKLLEIEIFLLLS
jgi:hypothetical protein